MEKKLPAIFLGHGDPMITLANNETTKNISKLEVISMTSYCFGL